MVLHEELLDRGLKKEEERSKKTKQTQTTTDKIYY